MNIPFLTFVCYLFLGSFAVLGQFKEPKDVSMEELMLETQYTTEDPDKLSMIWWLPFDFWEVSHAQDPTSTFDEIEALRSLVEGYEILAVVAGDVGYFGGINYAPKETVLQSAKIEYKGETLRQVSENEIKGDLSNFFAMMKPMLASMFGPMGENMHFIFFENTMNKEVLPIDPKENESVTFTLGEYVKEVALPLNSLLLEKKCPKDNALHSGKWTFCPFHGDKLQVQ